MAGAFWPLDANCFFILDIRDIFAVIKQNIMTNKRAIEILTDLSEWLNDSQPLHWSATEISQAIAYAKVEIYPLFAAKVLHDYRDWLEFRKPFYHRLDNLIDALNITIESLNPNQ